MGVVCELKLKEYADILADDLENLDETYIAKTVMVLKELDLKNLIPAEIADKIQNENIKALVQSCLN